MKVLCVLISFVKRGWDRFYMFLARSMFREIGKNVVFHPSNSSFTYSNISLGNDVFIGDNARFGVP